MSTEAALDLELFVFEEECKCEANHEVSRNFVCSRVVTHHYTARCTQRSVNVCAAAAAYVSKAIAEGSACRPCMEPARECWKIFPV